jgi:acyl-CoA synthetase (NDP forming)
MADPGIELILGARRDPVFGPVVLAGMGGIFTEVFRDTITELAPVDRETALSMLGRLKGSALLKGYRSRPAVDLEAVADSLVILSRLIVKRRDIAEVDINPLIAGPEGAVAVDSLIRLVSPSRRPRPEKRPVSTVDPFFNPGAMALIGASKTPGKGGNIILRNLLKAGFRGRIIPINPGAGEILGMKAYPRVSAVPGAVDLAMVVIPKASVPEALADCAIKGVKNVILSTGGYSDMGEEGSEEQKAIVGQAAEAGIRLMGPNSIGVINPRTGLATSIVGLEQIRPGGVSLIGQSGVFSSGWGRWIADTRPFGIAKVACIGNKGDINESDLLGYLSTDPDTSTIGMYLEGVVDGERFVREPLRPAGKKPVVVVKSERARPRRCHSLHTGSLAGSDAVSTRSAEGQAGAGARLGGLLRQLSAFESLPLPGGSRMGVLSITGMAAWSPRMPSKSTADPASAQAIDAEEAPEVIPAWAPVRNPVDIWSAVEQHGSQKTMRHIAESLIGQKDIDALLMIFVLMPSPCSTSVRPSRTSSGASGQARAGELLRRLQKGDLPPARGFLPLGVPTYPTPERALYAFSRMVEYARFHGRIRRA